MKKIYLAFFLASLICQDCLAQDAGNPDISWYNSNNQTYVLSTAEQLLGLSKLISDGNQFEDKIILLSSDINLENISWIPIGTPDMPFCGQFDGELHKVTINEVSGTEYAGLFGYAKNATIKNVSVTYNKVIDNCQNFGGIVAASDANTIISYCSHKGSVIVNDAFAVGGISASSDSYIYGCSNDGPVISNQKMQSFVGGIVGTGNPIIENSFNNASVTGKVIVGGIVGKLSSGDNKISLSNCVNNGEVIVTSNSDNYAYHFSAGGLIGFAPYVYLTSCWNEGKVSVISYKDENSSSIVEVCAAGLIGEGAGNIKYCYNLGHVFVRNVINSESNNARINNAVAGIIGMNTEKGITEISYSYNTGNILTFGQAPIKVSQNYGGIVGNIKTFMPKFTGVFSLEECCKVLDSNGSTVTSTFNNSEIQVSKEQMTSSDFLVPVKSTITLNNDLVYLFDRGNKNNGFPVLKSVITATPSIDEDGNCILHGTSKLTGKRYFKYWISGMESYSVDIPADDNFQYSLGKVAEGEHNIKAYIVLPDNTVIEGDKMSFVIRNSEHTQFDVNSTGVFNNYTIELETSKKKTSSSRQKYKNRSSRRR